MQYRKTTDYALSLPERLVRSLSGIVAGGAQEIGEVILPLRVRRSRLYSSVVGATLQFLIEQVAELEKTGAKALPQDFVVRRIAGNVVEIAGIAAFHASPVWVLAALSDLAGAGRDVISQISEALHEAGLLRADQNFSNVSELLNGLEMTAAQMVQSVHMPPLNVAALRDDWQNLCFEASRIPLAALPDTDQIRNQWDELKQEAMRQQRSVLELSSLLALAAVRALPENTRWLSQAVRVSGKRTGEIFANTLLNHYRDTLNEIRSAGYLRYWFREFQPYFKGAVHQFSTRRRSTTERLLQSVWPNSH
jgi:hypothetical protein